MVKFGELVKSRQYRHLENQPKSQYLRLKRLIKQAKREGETPAVRPQDAKDVWRQVKPALDEDLRGAAAFVEEALKGVRDKTRRFEDLLRGKRARRSSFGGTWVTKAVASTVSSTVTDDDNAVATADIRKTYLFLSDLLQYARIQLTAATKVLTKMEKHLLSQLPEGDGAGTRQALEDMEEQLENHQLSQFLEEMDELLSDLEELYPVEQIAELQMLAKQQEEPGDRLGLRWGTRGTLSVVVIMYLMAVVVIPIACRMYLAQAWQRCVIMIIVVVVFNLANFQDIYCTALMIPLFAVTYGIFPGKDAWTVSLLVIGRMFNDTSFLLLGAFVVCAIMSKCQLEIRIGNLITPLLDTSPSLFFFWLMIGSLAMASVLFGGAAALLMLSVVLPIARDLPQGSNHAKRWLLGIAFACGFGAFLLPISGPPALIAISLLREYGATIDFGLWMLVSVPVCFLCTIAAWMLLCIIYPVKPGNPFETEEEERDEPHAGEPVAARRRSSISGALIRRRSSFQGAATAGEHRTSVPQKKVIPLTPAHWLFLLLCVVFLVLVSFSALLEVFIGSPAIIALVFVAVGFGSGFLNEGDLRNLPWDILMLVAGGNVIAFCLRESGLALIIAQQVLRVMSGADLWMLCAVVNVIVAVFGTFFPSTMIALMFFPVVAILGISIGAPQVVMLLAVFAVQSACALEFSSLDNFTIYKFAEDDFRQKFLNRRDFLSAGIPNTCIALVIQLTIGFALAVMCFGAPDGEAESNAHRSLSPTAGFLHVASIVATATKGLAQYRSAKAAHAVEPRYFMADLQANATVLRSEEAVIHQALMAAEHSAVAPHVDVIKHTPPEHKTARKSSAVVASLPALSLARLPQEHSAGILSSVSPGPVTKVSGAAKLEHAARSRLRRRL